MLQKDCDAIAEDLNNMLNIFFYRTRREVNLLFVMLFVINFLQAAGNFLNTAYFCCLCLYNGFGIPY